MPQSLTKLKVFISCPSNLDAERATVAKVIETLGLGFSKSNAIIFEVFDWKRDVVPGIGLEPQDVVLSQLDYDIYIGLLGSVFGTRTNDAGSGTEAEFRQAYSRYKQKPSSVRVLFYFSTSSPQIFDIDPEQLTKVKQFRSILGQKGVLYQDFPDLDELRDRVSDHIRQLITSQWADGEWRVLTTAPQELSEGSAINQDDSFEDPHPSSIDAPIAKPTFEMAKTELEGLEQEVPGRPGLLELIINAKAAAKEFQGHTDRMTELPEGLLREVTAWSAEFECSNSAQDHERSKEICDSFAEKMLDFKQALQSELPRYQAVTSQLSGVVQTASDIYFEEYGISREELDGLLESFETFNGSLRNIRFQLQRFGNILTKTPSLTMALRAAKKNTTAMMDEFVSSYTVYLGFADALAFAIRQRLKLRDDSTEN